MRAAADAGDTAAMKAADFDFHAAVVELAGHARLREHYRMLHVPDPALPQPDGDLDYQLDEIAAHARRSWPTRSGPATPSGPSGSARVAQHAGRGSARGPARSSDGVLSVPLTAERQASDREHRHGRRGPQHRSVTPSSHASATIAAPAAAGTAYSSEPDRMSVGVSRAMTSRSTPPPTAVVTPSTVAAIGPRAVVERLQRAGHAEQAEAGRVEHEQGAREPFDAGDVREGRARERHDEVLPAREGGGGVWPSTTSRTSPPPRAVITASSAMPTTSNSCRMAMRAPDTPNANRPVRVSAVCMSVGSGARAGQAAAVARPAPVVARAASTMRSATARGWET